MKLQHAVVTIVCLLVTRWKTADGQCSARTVVTELSSCLVGLNKITDFTKGQISVAEIKAYCVGQAASETRCAEGVINRCRSSSEEVREILDKTVNINAIRGSMKIVCDANNTAALAEKQDCLSKYQPGVGSCIVGEYTAFQAESRSLQSRALSKGEGVDWLKEKLYEALCDYTGELKQCQKPFGQNCGKEVEMIFDALNHAVTPPVCSSVMANVNLVLLISLAFFAVVKAKF